MTDCIFCSIAQGKIQTELIYKDEQLMVVKDINPQAPVHLLVIPLKHYPDINAVAFRDPGLVAALLEECSRQGQQLGKEGYRIVINTGKNGGQTVDHLHCHVLAGRELQWPPG